MELYLIMTVLVITECTCWNEYSPKHLSWMSLSLSLNCPEVYKQYAMQLRKIRDHPDNHTIISSVDTNLDSLRDGTVTFPKAKPSITPFFQILTATSPTSARHIISTTGLPSGYDHYNTNTHTTNEAMECPRSPNAVNTILAITRRDPHSRDYRSEDKEQWRQNAIYHSDRL